jgi:hypothetical protein
MTKFITSLFFLLLSGVIVCGAQQEELAPDLKAAALRDSSCTKPAEIVSAEPLPAEPLLTALPIRSGGKELGTIVQVQGACHCQTTNCDALVYLRDGHDYRLALHEKYASLHPMKIVKLGMPSLTGQFEVSSVKMETTVYDWDGKTYKPSLCATVIKGKRVPSITRHPCKSPAQ